MGRHKTHTHQVTAHVDEETWTWLAEYGRLRGLPTMASAIRHLLLAAQGPAWRGNAAVFRLSASESSQTLDESVQER